MADCSQVPQWVSSLQALSLPTVALVGAWIAARQMLIADEKLKLDAFDRQYDRRVAVYEATRRVLDKAFRGRLAVVETLSFGLRALDAQFLFNEAMYKYLRDVHFHLEALREAQGKNNRMTPVAEREEYERIVKVHSDWLIEQGADGTGIGGRFAPFLVYTAPKRPWYLRWP